MRHMNAIATPKSAPDADLGAFTKEFPSRTGSRQVSKLDEFSCPLTLVVGRLVRGTTSHDAETPHTR